MAILRGESAGRVRERVGVSVMRLRRLFCSRSNVTKANITTRSPVTANFVLQTVRNVTTHLLVKYALNPIKKLVTNACKTIVLTLN